MTHNDDHTLLANEDRGRTLGFASIWRTGFQ